MSNTLKKLKETRISSKQREFCTLCNITQLIESLTSGYYDVEEKIMLNKFPGLKQAIRATQNPMEELIWFDGEYSCYSFRKIDDTEFDDFFKNNPDIEIINFQSSNPLYKFSKANIWEENALMMTKMKYSV